MVYDIRIQIYRRNGKTICKRYLHQRSCLLRSRPVDYPDFYGPLTAPSLKEVANGHSTGNAVDIAASTATMYKLNNSLIKVEAMCIEGVTMEAPWPGSARSR